jgi:hypothetical protein
MNENAVRGFWSLDFGLWDSVAFLKRPPGHRR